MADSVEPTMNTLAAVDALMKEEIRNRWESVLRIWRRKDFGSWLKIYSIDNGLMTAENAHYCVDWGYVADALFALYVADYDAAEELEMFNAQ